jgi:hypothetical protein
MASTALRRGETTRLALDEDESEEKIEDLPLAADTGRCCNCHDGKDEACAYGLTGLTGSSKEGEGTTTGAAMAMRDAAGISMTAGTGTGT